MLVSYIVPTFNVPVNDLRNCLLSIVEDLSNKSFKSEIVVCDDGSDSVFADCYRNICADISNKIEIKFVRHRQNAGLGENLNKGIDAAEGEYIFRLDPDDRNVLGRTEKQLKLLMKFRCDFSAAAVRVVDASGKTVNEKVKPLNSNFFCRLNCKYGSPFFHSSLAFRRDIFDRYQYPQRGSGFDRIEDLMLIWELLSDGACFINERTVCVVYRDHSSSLSKFLPADLNEQKEAFRSDIYRQPRLSFASSLFWDLLSNKRSWFLLSRNVSRKIS